VKKERSLCYFSNGRIASETTYVNGKKEGARTKYYPSGQIYEKGFFASGKKEGLQEFFFPDGSIKTKMLYKEGALKEVIVYNKNGNIIYKK